MAQVVRGVNGRGVLGLYLGDGNISCSGYSAVLAVLAIAVVSYHVIFTTSLGCVCCSSSTTTS